MGKLWGAPLSPFVRKVRVILNEKKIRHDLEPLIPLNVPDDYKKRLHPMGKIPCWEDENGVIPDSSAISVYLERLHPDPALYPSRPYEYARAVWLEEYADTAVVTPVATTFFQRIVGPGFLNQTTDEALVKDALENGIPPVFDYLEGQLDDGAFVGGTFSIADIAIASILANFRYAGGSVDGSRWPNLAGWLDATLSRPSFEEAAVAEKAMLGR